MVKLLTQSKIDSKQFPFLHQWDSEMRQNHAFYQNLIDKITFNLQRSQGGFTLLGSWVYPKFYQTDLLQLELYSAKQQIGKVLQEEVDVYKQINPYISQDLNRTFNSKWLFPMTGIATGGALVVGAQFLNIAYSFRLAVLWIPIALELCIGWSDKTTYFKTLDFLKWDLQYRQARARIERSNRFVDELKPYKQFIKSETPILDLYQELVQLARNN